MKGVYQFRGLKVPQVTEHFKAFKKEIEGLDLDNRIELSVELLKSEYSEDKLFGMMALEKLKLNL